MRLNIHNCLSLEAMLPISRISDIVARRHGLVTHLFAFGTLQLAVLHIDVRMFMDKLQKGCSVYVLCVNCKKGAEMPLKAGSLIYYVAGEMS